MGAADTAEAVEEEEEEEDEGGCVSWVGAGWVVLDSFETSFPFFCSWREERSVSDRKPPEPDPTLEAPEFSG